MKLNIFLLTILVLIFFWKIFLGKMPIPSDMLVGAYYPWLNEKWGYSTGVPVKNPIISDSFSQMIPWRVEGVRQILSGIWPLWNPYSFAGTPLLGNWHSAVLYPFNLLIALFGEWSGWGFLVIFQFFVSSFGMYFFLKEKGLRGVSCLFGSVVFSWGGFMMIFATYGIFSQAVAWLPWMMWCIERFYKNKNTKTILALPLFMFLNISVGSFQICAYSIGLVLVYTFYKKVFLRSWFFLVLGIGMGMVVLLPVLETYLNSIRTLDNNIKEYAYGLIPLKNLITFLAPDYFGNPTTYNFRGYLYHETTWYMGIITIPLAIYGVVFQIKRGLLFWPVLSLLCLVVATSSPLSTLIYDLNIPLLSTSYASRINLLLGFSLSILAGLGVDNLIAKGRKGIFYFGIVFIITFLSALWVFGINKNWWFADLESLKYNISFRNLILPVVFSGMGLLSVLIAGRNRYIMTMLLFLITVIDLFRFGWKYIPFTEKKIFFPTTKSIDFLKSYLGNYRFDREVGPLLPPNTWMYYGLASPSGYDPLYPLSYGRFYKLYNNGNPDDKPSRYAEMQRPDSDYLDIAGVKYVLSLEKDNFSVKDGGKTNDLITPGKYKKVFEEETVVTFENTKVFPRAFVFFNKDTLRSEFLPAKIVEYKPSYVKVSLPEMNRDGFLFLSDNYFPGWTAKVDLKERKVDKVLESFRSVAVRSGDEEVVFEYRPWSFYLGLVAFSLSLLLLGYQGYKRRLFRF